MSKASRTTQAPRSAERRLPPEPASVASARELVRTLLAETGREDLAEAGTLLVSELVTNAMLHAGTAIDVIAHADDAGLRVEVTDGSRHLPVRRHYATTSGTGRGMMMLEQMVDGWGVYRHSLGKTVWFHLSTGDHEAPVLFREDLTGVDGGPGDTVDVVLANLPLLLHAAWQEHIEALLREYLLASLEDDDPLPAVQVHAAATDAIAVLDEHIPRLSVSIDPDELMAEATEPNVTAEHIVMPVPLTSVPSFVTLERAIVEALELSRSGRNLTPTTQPELQAFRQWLCRQVAVQAAGGPPTPWSVDEEAWSDARIELRWDSSQVTGSDVGMIAADEANRMLAVSRPALELLGYDDPAELVGRRIVSIVPERLRQAHIAGFTMFLLVGRKPLIGRTVTVPALRRDGSEVLIDLEITTTSVGDGHQLFLAEMRPAG